MSGIRVVISACLALLVACAAASGATYYVSTSGNDGWPGSSSQPWRTLQHAVDAITNGDTIIVRSGTYAGCQISTSGTQSLPKTLKAETVGGVTLNSPSPDNLHNGIVELEGGTISYWVIDGFRVDGINKTYRCIDTRGTNHVTIKNCTTFQAYRTGIFHAYCDYVLVENNTTYSNGEHGVYCNNSPDYGTVRGNTSYSNTSCGLHHNGDASMGGDGIMSYWLIEKNTCYSNPSGSAINCDGVWDSKIFNNLLYNNTGSGMSLYAIDGTNGSSNNKVYNNTVVMPSGGRWCINIPSGSGTNPVGNKIKNNILHNASSSRGSITTYATSISGFESDYNIVIDRFSANEEASTVTLATWRTYGWDTHSIISTPSALFVNPGGNDYHLLSSSPARNAGTTLTDVTSDKDGNSRPMGSAYDIGCYEYVEGGGAPNITTTSLPNGQIAVAYSQTLAATGGTTPYTWAISAGSLPAGLSLNTSSGAITGTPTTSGTSSFTARVTDALSATDTQALSIAIPTNLSITTSSLPGGTVGTAYSQTLAATGGVTPYSWSLSSGTLPSGLSLTSGGVISGTPTASGTSNFTARVTDSQAPADTATKALSIVITTGIADLVITTTSLPGGTVGSSYSQTLAATGGVTPYTWSLSLGSLPAGLSLNTSSGAITGTPTASGTSNFTARVTDSQGTPDTATKALSIVISAGGSEPTYRYTASDSETTTTSTAYQTKATLTFTPAVADDWIIFGFAEVKENNTSYRAETQMLVDGVVEAQQVFAPQDTTDYVAFSTAKFKNLTTASHTISLQYRTSSASATAYMRNARIVAIRKASIAFYQTASDSTVALTTTMTDVATLTFTPAVSNDYLFIWSAEINANSSYSTLFECHYDGVSYDDGTIEVMNTANYITTMSFGMFTPSAASHTAKLRAAKETGSTATHNIRRVRVMAIQLSGGRFSGYWGQSSDGESTTTSTAWVEKRSCTWTTGNNGNWLLLNSARIANTSATYSTEARVQVNDSTTSGQQLVEPKDTTDYMNFNVIDVRNLGATRDADTDYRSENAAATAKIKKCRMYQLPLD